MRPRLISSVPAVLVLQGKRRDPFVALRHHAHRRGRVSDENVCEFLQQRNSTGLFLLIDFHDAGGVRVLAAGDLNLDLVRGIKRVRPMAVLHYYA